MSTAIHERRTTGFPSLDDDVWAIILAELSKWNLLPLSRTCKYLRELCLPILFRHCSISSERMLEYAFLPKTMRRYVRTLHLNDKCPDMPWEGIFYARYPSHLDRKALRFTTHPLVCGIYDGPTLRNALSHMPMLHSVTLGLEYRTVHGIPWPVLQFILSLPQIREFSLRFHHFAPKTPQEDIHLVCPAPLTSFEHILNDRRPHNTFYDPADDEEHAISVVLRGVHKTMERLVLTTEIAPLHPICTTLDWPNLRELRLRGKPRTVGDPPLAIIAMFAHMSRLRILDLKLMKPEESPPRPIWPIRYKAKFPWPELQELTVSFPDNKDLLYRKLPDTLRALTLQCFPHITSKFRQHGAEGLSGPIQSSDLLRILRRCNLPLLRSLELEYREDDQDDELLRDLGAAFPELRQLKVRRYRREGVRMADVPVEHIARTLGSLPPPLDLSLYLDNVEAPDTRVVRGVHRDREEDLAHKFQETLDGVADAVARGLASTTTAVETFALLIPENFDLRSEWRKYRVERGEGPPRAVRCVPVRIAGAHTAGGARSPR